MTSGMDIIDPVHLLRRQYLQLLNPEQLTLPPNELLRLPGTQAQIFDSMFDESALLYPPPDRYKFLVLKRLVKALEAAIEDPQEDEISDDLSGCLAQYMSQPLPSTTTAAKQKSYVTYTVPTISLQAPHFTLFEAPSLLASSGITGFRTWEAALFLGAYLASSDGGRLVLNKAVIELGAGTGFLSVHCANNLGARFVLATDGSREIINDLQANLDLNSVVEGQRIQSGVLQWGHALIGGIADRRDAHELFDLVIGADVTYDVQSIPSLVATIRDLFELYPRVQCLISATVRNEETLLAFDRACHTNGFTIRQINLPMTATNEQIGFFIPTTTPIHVFLISKEGPPDDPFQA